MANFNEKKRLREAFPAEHSLSIPRVVIVPTKSACGKLPSSNRACEIQEFGPAQQHQIWLEVYRESAVWPEKTVQVDRTADPDLSGPLPGLKTVTQTRNCLICTVVPGD